MDILGTRHFVEIPGERTHELPPLLVRSTPEMNRLDRVMSMAEKVVQEEGLLPVRAWDEPGAEPMLERHRMDLALQLVEQYQHFLESWRWGDSILEWIRQCETTFEQRLELRPLLRPDVWPHAGRSSFVALLKDKAVSPKEIELDRAVGTRLNFRQPPPLRCFSDQFLLLLRSSVASSAFEAWSRLSPDPVSALPPERFTFDVVRMEVM